MSELRLPAETKYAAELAALAAADSAPRPPGWRLSPRAVEAYILGTPAPVGGVPITPKYIGDRAIVQVAIATLASDRALMLTGEPGTAKSWLSEHLAAAVTGTSELVVQGTAGTSEEHVKYGWNYALLLAEGPSERALVSSPILRAMREGRFARFEEITRTAPEIQDALISILSEKTIAIPELGVNVRAERGFSIIATANTRDRGVNEMSAALKRRFNFVQVPVVEDLEQEIAIVRKREAELRSDYRVGREAPDEIARLLVTLFQELRAGATKDGKTKVKSPAAVLSTAEAISVLFNAGILAEGFGDGRVGP
jgi:MoxR-like ATPase